jgi:hypothetical protein
MIPVKNFLSYFNCQPASARTLILSLGMVLILCSSFIPAKLAHSQDVKAGWLIPSTTGMERLAAFHDAHDPNSDLHLTTRKQTKVKFVKKLQPGGLAAERSVETAITSNPPITGFDTVERPAYYIFLFRYTLF